MIQVNTFFGNLSSLTSVWPKFHTRRTFSFICFHFDRQWRRQKKHWGTKMMSHLMTSHYQ